MQIDLLQQYLIIINIAAFIVQAIDLQIRNHGGKGIKPKILSRLTKIFGGALGTLIAEVIWNRKRNKKYLNISIHTLMWLMIQIALYIAIYGTSNQGIKLFCMGFYLSNKLLCIYLLIINIITFIMFAIDKIKALLGRWRVREVMLLALGLIGGSIGGLLAMDIFNHKVKSEYFIIGFPIILVTHLIILVYIVA